MDYDGITKERVSRLMRDKLLRLFGSEPENAGEQQIYKAACLTIRDIMAELWIKTWEAAQSSDEKQVIYLSMEFLPGPSLKNNVFNLGMTNVVAGALADFGVSFSRLCEIEPDAGLGNGGLGRLASCYLDALTTAGMVGHGMSICYEYGIFKQVIQNGGQEELPDDWQDLGDVWLVEKEEETEEVHLGGTLKEIWDETGKMTLEHSGYDTVLAVPQDMLITGYKSSVVNTLRLWKSKSPVSIDMELFAEGKYLKSMEKKHMAEVISKILYPEDAHTEGKSLRISQQYFFISASMKALVRQHFKKYKTLDHFHEQIAIHINDTHPTMAIPELMRIFMDDYGYQWEPAWEIVRKTVSYTNHTVMPEALEKWPEDLFASILPRIHSIVSEISRRQGVNLATAFPNEEALRREMAIIDNGQLRMANLCVEASHSVNGVSSLHSGIIRDKLFHGFYRMNPDKFTNVTNGIAYRRWLCQANPKLADLIEELCGSAFRKDASRLEDLMKFRQDGSVHQEMAAIKRENKDKLAKYIEDHNGIIVDPDSIFDVQVKRIHEYKRQLLNLFHIMDLYNQMKANPNLEIYPRTFLFAGKAAGGYYMAKQIIALAYQLSQMVDEDPDVRGRIKIVFLENYSVSLTELIMPAAEVSQQISLAGKEASGTGNMKLMINGAVTIGTMDGANVEIHEQVGDENIFIFGMRVDDVEKLASSGKYSPWSLSQENPRISAVVKLLSGGINGVMFGDLLNSLLTGLGGTPDPYFVLADFQSYCDTQKLVEQAYQDMHQWNAMSLTNIAKAGIFSADRAVAEYAKNIWNIAPISLHGDGTSSR